MEGADLCQSDCDLYGDADGDGHNSLACGGDDCDDADATRFPGNAERCDLIGHDEDCDPTTFGETDIDGDGYIDVRCFNIDAGGVRRQGDDCNDASAEVHPTAPEVCNGIDENCNGEVDEGLRIPLYPDLDHDGFGDASATATIDCPWAQGLADNNVDCDDTNASIFPGQIVCRQGQQGPDGTYELCEADGTTSAGACPNQGVCRPQPGGFGLCL